MLKVNLLYATAMYQMDSSDFDGAEAALKSAKHIASSLLPDRGLRESLSAQSGLTSVYLQRGLLNQAIATEEEVYRARENAFGMQDSDTIASLVQCGHATRELGKFKEARALYEKALRIQDMNHRVDKEQFLTTQAGLAATSVSAGNFKEGSKLQESIVNDRKTNLSEHDPQTLAAMNNLAVTLGLLGEFDKSEKLHREVLDVRRDLMGPLHLTTLTSSINLAQVYRAEGRWIEAEKLDRAVLGDMQKSLGREHTLTLAVTANLALTLRERGVILYDKSRGIVVRNHAQIHEARALATSSFEAYKQMFGTQHPDTLKSQELCASILW
jgi:tetratricopeptide (TPR) repeat protein